MSELIAYHGFNPSTNRGRFVVRESECKPHKLRLRGHENIGFETGANGNVDLHLPAGMRVVDDPDTAAPGCLGCESTGIALRPGQQVTLQFVGGQVLHTVSHLPNYPLEAQEAIRRAHVHSV